MKTSFFLLIILVAMQSCVQENKEINAVRKNLTEAVYAPGVLQPEDEYKVVANVDGYLLPSAVKEGDAVTAGQLLFSLSNKLRETQEHTTAQLVKRTAPLAGYDAPLVQELKRQLSQVNTQLQKDSLDNQRYRNLYAEQAVSKSSYEKYLLQYQSSLKQQEIIQERIRNARLTASLELQQAENNHTIARSNRANQELRSFTNGYVYAIYRKAGDLVNPNEPVALVGSNHMIARLSIDEEDYSKVKVGQEVLIKLDAFPGRVFKAVVQKIYPFLNGAEQSFKADAVFPEQLPGNVYGLNLEANIVIEENRDVMVVPKAALASNDSLWVKENGERKKIKVIKGIEDKDWVEIRKGITDKTIIVLP